MIPLPFAELDADDIFLFIVIFLAYVWPYLKKRLRPPEEEEPVAAGGEEVEEPSLLDQIKELALDELLVGRDEPEPTIFAERAEALQSDLARLHSQLKSLTKEMSKDQGLAALATHLLRVTDARLESTSKLVPRYLAGDEPDALDRLQDELHFLRDLIGGVKLVKNERSNAAQARILARGDALARAWYRPFYGKKSFPITSTISLPSRARRALSRAKIQILVVPAALDASPAVWGLLPHAVGRDLLILAPDLAQELFWRIRGNPEAPAPGSDGRIYRSDLDNLVAAWSEVLFADAIGSMLQGTAYLQALLQWVELAGEKEKIGIDRRRGIIHPDPPPIIRELFVIQMLTHLGLGETAERQMSRWYEGHSAVEALILPVGGEGFARIPITAMDEALGSLAEQFQLAPWETLGGRRLDGLNDVVFTGGMNESAQALTNRALRGKDLKTNERVALAAAVFAAEKDATAHQAIWAAVDGIQQHVAKKRAALRKDHAREGSFRSELRDAIVWREALLPRPGTPRARLARFHP